MSIQQSRMKLAVLTTLLAVLAVVLAFLTFISAFMPDLWAFLGISLFAPVGIAVAVAAGMHAMSWWKPGVLSADARGVVWRTWRAERVIAWDAVEDFLVFAPESRFRSPGCALKEAVGGRKFVSFGRNWEKSAEEIVEGLKAANIGDA